MWSSGSAQRGSSRQIGWRVVPSAELDLWEHWLGRKLPDDYRAFMARAGATRGARLLAGSTFFWPACLGIRQIANEELEPEEYAAIASGAIFIIEHQGYIFGWLDAADRLAPVYVSEPTGSDKRETRQVADSFRAYLLRAVSE